MGTLRFFLALLVLYSHAGGRIQQLNPGVTAVVVFYIISGYVMTALMRRYYCPSPAGPTLPSTAHFYLDRLLRLYPQYLFYAAAATTWFYTIGHPTTFLQPPAHAIDWLRNLLIAPLNWYMWNGADRYTLIPPAWSLGAEMQFYLLAPFVLLWPRRLLGLGLLGFGVYLLAVFGQVNSDWFGYRLLPGVLTFFLLGALLRHLHQHTRHRAALALVAAVVLLSLLIGALARAHGSLNQPYNQETLLGLILIFPLLHGLARRPRRGWDEHAGDLSYGLFLNHFLILWVVFPAGVSVAQLPLFLLLGLLLAFVSQRYVERPVLALRKKLRRADGR